MSERGRKPEPLPTGCVLVLFLMFTLLTVLAIARFKLTAINNDGILVLYYWDIIVVVISTMASVVMLSELCAPGGLSDDES